MYFIDLSTDVEISHPFEHSILSYCFSEDKSMVIVVSNPDDRICYLEAYPLQTYLSVAKEPIFSCKIPVESESDEDEELLACKYIEHRHNYIWVSLYGSGLWRLPLKGTTFGDSSSLQLAIKDPETEYRYAWIEHSLYAISNNRHHHTIVRYTFMDEEPEISGRMEVPDSDEKQEVEPARKKRKLNPL